MIKKLNLVIVLAETREYSKTFKLFERNLLNRTNSDLALCVALNNRENVSNNFYEKAKYVWQYKEPEDWGEAFDVIAKEKKASKDWRKLLSIKDQWLGGVKGDNEHPGSAGILLFFRWFLKEKLKENNLVGKYERFIITRSDYLHTIPHVPLINLDPSYIWIPHGEDYGGLTDRHLIVSSKYLIETLSLLDQPLISPDSYVEKMNFSCNWNLEKFIKYSFNEKKLLNLIKRYPTSMYTIRSPKGHTRWNKGTFFHEKKKYYIKYQFEYARTIIAKVFVRLFFGWNKFTIKMLNFIDDKFVKVKNEKNYFLSQKTLKTLSFFDTLF